MSLSVRNQILFLHILYYLTNLVKTVPLKVSDGVPDLFCGKPPIHIIFKPSTDVTSTSVETSIMELANSIQAEGRTVLVHLFNNKQNFTLKNVDPKDRPESLIIHHWTSNPCHNFSSKQCANHMCFVYGGSSIIV